MCFSTPLCVLGQLIDFAFACLLQMQIGLICVSQNGFAKTKKMRWLVG